MTEQAQQPTATDTPVAHHESELRQQVLQDPAVRALVLSRLASMLGIATLSYGSMVYLAAAGAPQVMVSLMGSSRYLAALVFGIGGGALADAMSKRTAIVTAYALQAAACFIVPTVWGTDLPGLITLTFVIAALGQIVTPAVKAATALVSTAAQVAVVAAIVSVAGGIGSALGSSVLAPVLINVSSMRTVAYVCGVVLAFGAIRALHVPAEASSTSLLQAARAIDWRNALPTLRRTAGWLNANRKAGMMILVGSTVAALYDGMNTLLPVYMRDVLQTDPTNAVYILAPGAIGFAAGTALGPWWMNRRGERALGVMAFMLLSLGFVLFGFIDVVAPFLAPLSPLRVFELFGAAISPQIKAAGVISILTALGSTGAGAAVQTYVNRYVLLARQATTFGMQEVADNALTLAAILILGTLATLLGSRLVFILAPPLVVALVVWLVRLCFRITTNDPPEARVILHSLLDTSRPRASQ